MQELIQEPTAERPGQILGNYTLLREAGRGGMSVVYEANDDRIERRVALKVVTVPGHLSAKQREEMIARLRREARAIARLSHPNVVHVYDVGEQDGAHYIVMEYLDGQTLRERLDDAPLSPEEASGILDQVAAALDAVHAEGVVHRDIKPSNVMLLPDGRVKLMDFGVARQTDDTLVTQAGMMVGSPAYMAPELINGGQASVSSDLWSLGTLLYQMLAGHPPFGSKNIPTVLYQVTHADPEPLKGAPPRVQKVITRALEKSAAKRFQSGREMAEAFRAAIAETPSPVAALRPVPRRRSSPRWLGPALAALLLLPAMFGASSLGRWLAARNRVTQAPAVQTAAPKPTRQARRSVPQAVTPLPPKPKPVVRVAESFQEKKTPARTTPRRHTPRRRAIVSKPVAVPRPARRVASPVRRAVPPVRRIAVPARRPAPLVRQIASVPAPRMQRRRQVAIAPTPRMYKRRPHTYRTARPRPPAAPLAPAAPRQPTQETKVPSGLEGTWHGWQGIHGKDPVTLKINHHRGQDFDGVMTVRTPERATVRVGLTGHVSSDGQVTMRERKILSSTKPHAWDLGSKMGRLNPNGQMSGQDHDVIGRTSTWSFSR